MLWQVEVEPMYFNFALNFYKTLSSADNSFKQFGPRSSQTFCPDLIGVQTVWHLRSYDKLKLEPMYFDFALNLYMILSSADNPFKQFGPRSSPTYCPDLIGVQTVWHFRGYDKLKLNRCILTLSSADNLFKQFGTRLRLTFCLVWKFLTWSRSKLFDTVVI